MSITSEEEENGKNIRICGGANLIRQFANEDAINAYYITVILTLFGSGIRLFKSGNQETPLRLLKIRSYNGMTDLLYTKR